MKRRRIAAEKLMQEAEQIACFRAVKVVVTKHKYDRVYIKELFEAYQSFLHEIGLPDTVLTIDGFGRMLHINAPRKVMKIGREPIARGFVGVKIIEKKRPS